MRERSVRKGTSVLLGAAVVVVVAALGVGAQDVRSGKWNRVTVTPRGGMELRDARGFSRYPLYFAGTAFEGLPLTAIDAQRGWARNGEPTGVDEVMFAYGTCTVPAEVDGGGCAVPLTVQVWSACERYQGLYGFPADEELTIRGTDAAFYENFKRLEVYTGRVTVVLFGTGRDQLLGAAGALHGVNNPVTTGDALPARAGRATRGNVAC